VTAIRTFLDLYEGLVDGEWVLEKSHYEFFARQVVQSINGIFARASLPPPLLSYQNTFKTLEEKEGERRKITEKLLTFQENAAPMLLEIISRKATNPRNSGNRFELEFNGWSYLISLLNVPAKDAIGGILLSEDLLKTKILLNEANEKTRFPGVA
jgi:hypothetical protein